MSPVRFLVAPHKKALQKCRAFLVYTLQFRPDNKNFEMKKIIISIGTILLLSLGLYFFSLHGNPNENYLQAAKEATTPNFNFLFASNASLPGRIGMTLTGKKHKTCINTITAFFNKYHTCSNCEDFVKNPEKWNFQQISTPETGDMVIQHDPKTGRAYHAAIIVDIKNDQYYVNHAIRTNYYKNVKLRNKTKLSFYRYISH